MLSSKNAPAKPLEKSIAETPNDPPAVPKKTAKWPLLADCSHSSAVAVGQRARLAFHKNGLHAFGGYLEGFLPAEFAVEAVASDDRILRFLALADDLPELTRGPKAFVLSRGDVEVRFESDATTPLPKFPALRSPKVLPALDLKLVDAILKTVPKSGWGAFNADFLGIVASDQGLMSTDNICFAWSPPGAAYPDRVVLPRPFLMALLKWAAELGSDCELQYAHQGILARWGSGEWLFGALPSAQTAQTDFSGLCEEMKSVGYSERPVELGAYLDEAAIFSDDVLFVPTTTGLHLQTPGDISWHRDVAAEVEHLTRPFTMSIKLLRTAVDHADQWAIGADRVYLSTEAEDLYIVVGAKTGKE